MGVTSSSSSRVMHPYFWRYPNFVFYNCISLCEKNILVHLSVLTEYLFMADFRTDRYGATADQYSTTITSKKS